MIFVVLGTWEMPFLRPLLEIERAAADGLIGQPILVQSGKTTHESAVLQLTPFFDQEKLESLYQQASLVICQAGVGSIMLGLRKRKKVIAIARRQKYDEHIDDHQLEILDTFAKSGTILPWRGEGDLPNVLQRVSSFAPSEYPFSPERISDGILDYLRSQVKV